MKLVQIGAAGHFAYALPTAKKYGLDLTDFCVVDGDDDPTPAIRAFEKFGFAPKRYSDYREMLKTEHPDVAVVNPVMGRNAEIAAFALSMGISVFCEKPLATTFDDLSMLESVYEKARANRKNVRLCGMFGIDYLPHFETAYRYVKSGGLGDVRLANGQKSYKMGNREPYYSDRERYGGTIPWVAIHAVEWIERIGGLRPVTVSALQSTACNGGNGTMEASCLLLLGCEGGKMASVSADVMRPAGAPTHDDDRLRLVGSEGVLEVRGGRVFVLDGTGERELPLVSTETELFEELILELRGEGVCRVSAEDAFFATRTALAARLAADTGETVRIDEAK